MDNLIIVGAGGFGKHLKSNIKNFNSNKYNFVGFFDKNIKLKTKFNEKNIKKNSKKYVFANGIGNFSYSWYPKIFLKYKKLGFEFINLIHKTAIISNKVKIGLGSVFMENSLVKSGSQIGDFCIINSSAIVSHDVDIGDYCNISLGAKIGGNCKIGKNTFLGINSTIIQGIKIGSNSIIGAGAVVTKDVGNNVVVIGNPAFEYRDNK